jgi:hypothetical protein
MALIKLNNNSISAVSALPSGITTGKILQHQFFSSYVGNTAITSTSNVATPVTDKITASSSSNKIIITAMLPVFTQATTSSGGQDWFIRSTFSLYRGSTNLGELYSGGGSGKSTGAYNYGHATDVSTFSWVDTPNSTDELTYTIYLRIQRLQGNGGQANPQGLASMTLMEIAP